MFKNILSFFQGRDFLNQALDEFKQMLTSAETMYQLVHKVLLLEQDVINLKEEVYAQDKKINDLERGIRKRIIEHLAVNPSVDVSACLVLMSVVKDAERLGDYCKNLFEVTNLTEGRINKEKFNELFNGMDQELTELFQMTKTAFMESDHNTAASSWDFENKIAKRCDEIVEKLAQSDLTTNEAVCFTLIARHFKRLSAHLANIATSVILPIDELDYFDEKRMGQIKEE